MKNKRHVIKMLMFLIALAFLFFMGWFGYSLMHTSYDSLGLITVSIAIALSGWLLLSVAHYLCNKRTWMIVLLFFGLYSYGVYTYERIEKEVNIEAQNTCDTTKVCDTAKVCETITVLSPINNTLSIFFPSRGTYKEDGYEKVINYQIVHLLSYLFFAFWDFPFLVAGSSIVLDFGSFR